MSVPFFKQGKGQRETAAGARGGSRRLSRRGERGFVLIMAAAFFIVAIPMVGLSVDLGIQYMIQTKLQMSLDSAVLAGARSLSLGNDTTTQIANAGTTAQAYLTANFPAGYLGVSAPTVTNISVNTTVAFVRSVSMSANATVPLWFLSGIAGHSTKVNATATATRRSTNVIVVMDRSGSLQNSGSCTPVKNAAAQFVSYFSDGTDNVGLITFATSSRQDFPLATNFNTASPSVSTIIGETACTGATSSAQALWQGYQALAALNQPSALNVILFFTDGQPTAVTASLPVLGSSSCNSHNNQLGVFTVGFQTSLPYSPVATGGVFTYAAQAQPITTDVNFVSGSTGCSYTGTWSNAYQDIQGVPTTDYWGNSLIDSHATSQYASVTTSGSLVTIPSNSTGALNMIAASSNAADDAAARIRSGASPNTGGVTGLTGMTGVTIFCIGLGNSTYPANDDILQRIANDPSSATYSSSAPTGLYVSSPTTADLSDAFARVASEILRLSR